MICCVDKVHREEHVRTVILQSLKLAEEMPECDHEHEMVYIIADFNDSGLTYVRERNHKRVAQKS